MSVNHMLKNHNSSIDISTREGQEFLQKLLREKKLGLTGSNSIFNHCSVTLSPWNLPEYQFQRVQKIASVLSKVFSEISLAPQYLLENLADYQATSGLLAKLKQILLNTSTIKATNYNFSRQDFLLDTDHQWRLVESNSIAAGMGPFNETVIEVQQQLAINHSLDYAYSPAKRMQSMTLVQAASKLRNNANPLIIFVVEKNEDNIHDQIMLAEEIIQLGGRVQFRTFSELKQELVSERQQLSLKEFGLVDLIYYRTGYNLDDYMDKDGHFENLLQIRPWIEQHKVIVSPSISHQISTSKWIQMKLSKLSITELSTRFKLSKHQATIAAIALNSQYSIPGNVRDIQLKLVSDQWLLKSQNEGGGNVFDKRSEVKDYCDLDMNFILMKKISSIIRDNKIEIMKNNQIKKVNSLISELGIFTLGNHHQYGGYLLRTKDQYNLEAGVHKGGGILDAIAFS